MALTRATDDLERGFRRRLAEAEQRRVTWALRFFWAMFLFSVPMGVLEPEFLNQEFDKPPALQMIFVCGAMVVAAMMVKRRVTRMVAEGRGLSLTEGLVLTAGELSLVAIIFAIALAEMRDPAGALFSPAAYILPVIVVLSAQRMEPIICWFAGSVAGGMYGLVSILALQHESQLPPYMLSPVTHGMVTTLLFAVGAAAAAVTTTLRQTALSELRSMHEKSAIRRVFGQHVSPEVVDQLLAQKDGEQTALRHVCTMFVDIRGFTTFAETRDPRDVVSVLNRFLALSIDAINTHQGIVNKFLGDGFMAVFGAPIDDERAVHNAVEAAEAILAGVDREVAAGSLPPMRVGIGVHAGDAITGSIGSPQRKEYAIIGDTVNLAARVEALNKQFGSQLLVTRQVWEPLGRNDADVRVHRDVAIRGRDEAVSVYELA